MTSSQYTQNVSDNNTCFLAEGYNIAMFLERVLLI